MIKLTLHQTRYDLLTFGRNRQGRFFTALLPVIFLVIFVSVFGNNRAGSAHVKASTYYVPGIAALALLSASFANLVISVTAQRELGVLKRRRATPVPARVLLAGRALSSLVIAVAVMAVVIAITLPLYFISGVFIPSARLSAGLRHLAEIFPVQHLVAALHQGFVPGAGGVPWSDLAIVTAWGIAGLALALTRFSWVPKATSA
jgi:ABC-2 type transport system permease protein